MVFKQQAMIQQQIAAPPLFYLYFFSALDFAIVTIVIIREANVNEPKWLVIILLKAVSKQFPRTL